MVHRGTEGDDVFYGIEQGYKGATLTGWNGQYKVLESAKSEPDGAGGFLVDLRVKADATDKVSVWPNMHTSVIEDMMVD